MLTKISNTNKWKLIISIPLLAMSILAMKPISDGILNNMDKSSGVTKDANTTIEWVTVNRNDTIEVLDAPTSEYILFINFDQSFSYAKALNNLPVRTKYIDRNDYLNNILGEQFINELKVKLPKTASINMENVVIDKDGKILYYDLNFYNKENPLRLTESDKEQRAAIKKIIIMKIADNLQAIVPALLKNEIIFSLYYSKIKLL